jgi:hypothetical protein
MKAFFTNRVAKWVLKLNDELKALNVSIDIASDNLITTWRPATWVHAQNFAVSEFSKAGMRNLR